MYHYRDFIPKTRGPHWFFLGRMGEYESFDDALTAANTWIQRESIQVLSLETVWQGWVFHPRIRVWYQTTENT